jgi:hypothetical protein
MAQGGIGRGGRGNGERDRASQTRRGDRHDAARGRAESGGSGEPRQPSDGAVSRPRQVEPGEDRYAGGAGYGGIGYGGDGDATRDLGGAVDVGNRSRTGRHADSGDARAGNPRGSRSR